MKKGIIKYKLVSKIIYSGNGNSGHYKASRII
jgi:hypothetical protein